ncbi:patatin-like phospholipase family protein [Haloimpatiens sp. FM7315]|uniref:patatin-like phospholipase family protein n=1 Tax=Haloimpatiens sp. FM7315 TaxID=3298609 RepID=UPI00370C6271
MPYADAVFEGGGIKALGLIGALCYLEKKGYKFENVAGTSAGAIIAALVSAGYKGEEMKELMRDISYNSFNDKSANKFTIIKLINFIRFKGVYSGDAIEKLIYNLLKKKGKVKFKDVWGESSSKLKIIATDITKKDMLILPDDLKRYNIDPKEFEIARAVRMSIGIPFVFKPIEFKYGNNCSYVVDGGILSNFPIWIFDVKSKPKWPTFGFQLQENKPANTFIGKKDLISYTLDVISTLLDRNEMRYIRDKDMVRTISIPTLGVKTTEFNLSNEKKLKLYNSGYLAAEKFIGKWDFDRYLRLYRSK